MTANVWNSGSKGGDYDIGDRDKLVSGLNAMETAINTINNSITMSAAAGGANVSEVTITVVDQDGNAIAGVHHLDVYLSDAATGAGLTSTTASGTVTAKAASGVVIDTYTAKKALRVQTLATGIFILEITDSAKTGFYPCVINPATGKVVVGTVLATGDYGS